MLSANPDWWGGPVAIKHISFSIFANETSLALAMRAGEIDIDLGVGDGKSFSATSGPSVKVLAALSPTYGGMFTMNTHIAPWNDVHVRRAVTYAIDRANIITALGGYALPSYTLIPSQSLSTIASQAQIDSLLKSLNLYQHNIAKAKQEMAASAYPDGANATMIVWTPGAANIGQVIAAELDQIGLRVRLVVPPYQEELAEITGPADKRPAEYTAEYQASADPNSYMDFLGSWNLKQGEFNTADYAPPALDQLINAGIATSDHARRFAIYSAVLKRLSVDVPYVSLFDGESLIALAKNFSCPDYGPYFGVDYPWALSIKPAAV